MRIPEVIKRLYGGQKVEVEQEDMAPPIEFDPPLWRAHTLLDEAEDYFFEAHSGGEGRDGTYHFTHSFAFCPPVHISLDKEDILGVYGTDLLIREGRIREELEKTWIMR